MSIKYKHGFSLIEMTVGLLILGIVLINISDVYEQIIKIDHQQTEQSNILTIQQGFDTFLAVNSFLPCPDTDFPTDGLENRDTDVATGIQTCTDREGYLPYNDLGVRSKDAWGNDYYYRVNQQAENLDNVTQACSSASVLGRVGESRMTDLWLCPDSNVYYCKAPGAIDCDSRCVSACLNTIDPRPNSNNAPFFHLATPPFGETAGSGNLDIYHQNATPYDGTNGPAMDGGVVAVAISWGVNGDTVYRYSDSRVSCGGGTAAENINCADSVSFVETKTGEGRDFITWATVNQAKLAIIGTGEFR